LFRLRFIHNHIIIYGNGSQITLLAKRFFGHGYRVVLIEQNAVNNIGEELKSLGIITLSGDARDEKLLYKVRVHEARFLILFSDYDGINVEIAVHARKLVRNQKGSMLTCIVHVVDPQLCRLLSEKEVSTEKTDRFRLEFFNIFENGARAWLKEYPIVSETNRDKNFPPHLLIVGIGEMGENLFIRAAKNWKNSLLIISEKLRVTVIDKIAGQKVESLYLQYPQLRKYCDIVTLSISVESPEFQRAEFLYDSRKICDVTSIFVCLDDDSLGLSAALMLQNRLGIIPVPIVVRMEHDAGLASLLRERSREENFVKLNAFGLLDRTCEPELLLGGVNESLARTIHMEYINIQGEQGETPETNPSMVPWDELPENLRESNRAQGDSIITKVKAIGCIIAPSTNWNADMFEFTHEEIELMAEMEHDRWMTERSESGWTYAPGKKNIKKLTSRHLVSWTELPEEIKDIDRELVKQLPKFLAKVDLQIYR